MRKQIFEGMQACRRIVTATGLVCVGIGAVGMFVPLLPTTPFLLLAAFLFARSSPRFQTWLLTHRLFGKLVRDYTQERGMSRSWKAGTLLVLWLTIGVSVWVLRERTWMCLFLGGVAGAVSLHILLLKTVAPRQVRTCEGHGPDQNR